MEEQMWNNYTNKNHYLFDYSHKILALESEIFYILYLEVQKGVQLILNDR